MELVNSPYFECKRSYVPTTGRHHAKCIRCDIKQPHALLHPRTNNKTGRPMNFIRRCPAAPFSADSWCGGAKQRRTEGGGARTTAAFHN